MASIAGLSILLVEDEFLIALDAEQILRDLGAARVEIAGTFDGAQERTRQGTFDLAVLDVNLNGQLSFPLAEMLKQRGVPVVFATGYGLRDRPLAGFEGGVCVSKPYTSERLAAALAEALEGAQRT